MDSKYYIELLKLVEKSNKINEIPVGAIVIKDNKIIGKGYNNRQTTFNVCGHAEINAIKNAEKNNNDWRLDDCVLITTLQPCNMCSEVIKAARIMKVYYLIEQEEVNNSFNFELLSDDNEIIKKIKITFLEFFKKLR